MSHQKHSIVMMCHHLLSLSKTNVKIIRDAVLYLYALGWHLIGTECIHSLVNKWTTNFMVRFIWNQNRKYGWHVKFHISVSIYYQDSLDNI